MPTALIVEDEPVLAAELREELARLWPELTLFAPVHDGVAALREIEARRPDILFLDVQIPGLTGIEVARVALLRKRAGEVAKQWPMLAAGPAWPRVFLQWAADRPTLGALRDGWDLARELAARGELPALAGEELATREATMSYDGTSAPRRRRGPALRRAAGVVVLQIAGTVRTVRRA